MTSFGKCRYCDEPATVRYGPTDHRRRPLVVCCVRHERRARKEFTIRTVKKGAP